MLLKLCFQMLFAVGVFTILDKAFIATVTIWDVKFDMMKMLHFNIK